ncbi:MAG: ATP-binding protein [Armatimonadota bacterium]
MAMRQRSNVESVELRVPCKPEYVRTVRALVAELADSVPLSSEAVEEVKVAASEAVSNIVRHAYENADGSEPVVVRCWKTGGKLTVEVADRGIGFRVPVSEKAPPPEKSREREGGLGIVLIKNLMDSVDYWSQPNLGTRIKMTKIGWHRNGQRTGRTVVHYGAGL